MGFHSIGKKFAFKSALAIIALAIVIELVHHPVITNDKLLISVFGGFFLGLGIGLSIRGGAVIDGTEVLVVFLSKKSFLSIGDFILPFNIVIFSFGAYILSVETVLYAILTYLAASRTVDFVFDGIEKYISIFIISNRSEEIREMIIHKLGRGVTTFKGKRGFEKSGESSKDIEIFYTVIPRLEISKLNIEIEKQDPTAFAVMSSIKYTKGGVIKKIFSIN